MSCHCFDSTSCNDAVALGHVDFINNSPGKYLRRIAKDKITETAIKKVCSIEESGSTGLSLLILYLLRHKLVLFLNESYSKIFPHPKVMPGMFENTFLLI